MGSIFEPVLQVMAVEEVTIASPIVVTIEAFIDGDIVPSKEQVVVVTESASTASIASPLLSKA